MLVESSQKKAKKGCKYLQALAPDNSARYPFYLTKPWLQSVSTETRAQFVKFNKQIVNSIRN